MGLIPGQSAIKYQLWASCSHPCATVTKQYNTVWAKAQWCSAARTLSFMICILSPVNLYIHTKFHSNPKNFLYTDRDLSLLRSWPKNLRTNYEGLETSILNRLVTKYCLLTKFHKNPFKKFLWTHICTDSKLGLWGRNSWRADLETTKYNWGQV